MPEPIRQACILVGEMGTRLDDITCAVPKPLLEIAPDISFLDIVIEQIARQGFTDVLLLGTSATSSVSDMKAGRLDLRRFECWLSLSRGGLAARSLTRATSSRRDFCCSKAI